MTRMAMKRRIDVSVEGNRERRGDEHRSLQMKWVWRCVTLADVRSTADDHLERDVQ